jgi:hypothetical protein
MIPNEINYLMQTRFDQIKINPDEKLINYYTCALQKKILLTGTLFLTTHSIYFFSHFNDKDMGTFLGALVGIGIES